MAAADQEARRSCRSTAAAARLAVKPSRQLANRGRQPNCRFALPLEEPRILVMITTPTSPADQTPKPHRQVPGRLGPKDVGEIGQPHRHRRPMLHGER